MNPSQCIRVLIVCVVAACFCIALYIFTTPQVDHSRSKQPDPTPTRARWHVNGQDYMSAVADAIEAASDEIFISSWQMSAEIFMKRSDTGVDSLKWRLDNLLQSKANQGVKIYILLYNQPIAGIDLGSKYVLKSKYLYHENITILRHPGPNWPHCIHFNVWSHHEKIVVVDGSMAFVGGIDLAFSRWDTHNHELTDNYPAHPCLTDDSENHCYELEKKEKRYSCFVGKDYTNIFLQRNKIDYSNPMIDHADIDRNINPRMPWHDVACSFTDQPARDIRQYIIKRYNEIIGPHASGHIMPSRLYNTALLNSSGYEVKVQVLKSGGHWSDHEASIYDAYLETINNSKHYIYMENQFFISSAQGSLPVKNRIMATIAARILHAFNNNESFHFTLIIPLKPGFNSTEEQNYINFLNYDTLNKGEKSLCNLLKNGGIPAVDIHKYFSMYGLRTYGYLNGTAVTEIIYVHSKMMIVDDRIAIIGSANINDRSMLGDRDSEVAVKIEDTEMIDGNMSGKAFQVGTFSHSLRCHLIREHLGLLNSTKYEASTTKVDDPFSSLTEIRNIAKRNTKIYDEVFGGRITPTNYEQNYEQQKRHQSKRGLIDENLDNAINEIIKVEGNLVDFPESYLKEEPYYAALLSSIKNIDGSKMCYQIGYFAFMDYTKAAC